MIIINDYRIENIQDKASGLNPMDGLDKYKK